MTVSLLDAALWYASVGLPVLPLHTPTPHGWCSCDREDCDRIGKHPRTPRGLHDASNDPDQIRTWWRRWRFANLGVRTGVVADVCDIDSPTGLTELRNVLAGADIAAPMVRTGSGGWHVWVAPTGHGNRGRFLPDVDWRGIGGYVVAPPSIHVSGKPYTWIRPLTTPPPNCPQRLSALVAGHSRAVPAARDRKPVTARSAYAAAALDRELAAIRSARRPTTTGGRSTGGERNHTLNRAAFNLGQLVADDLLDAADVTAALLDAALDAGLGQREAHRTIASGLNAGIANPRRRGAA